MTTPEDVTSKRWMAQREKSMVLEPYLGLTAFSLHVCAVEAVDALGMAMANRFIKGPKAPKEPEIIRDNGSIFLAKRFMAETKFFCILQHFFPPREPENNGMIERFL